MLSDRRKHSVPETNGGAPWLTAGRFAAVLGLLVIASFPQVVAGLEVFVRLDAARFAYPLAFYHREAFWRGEIPLWNPLSNCGIPFLAQWNTMTLYPLSLFYLVFPLPWSFGVFCLGHLFLAGLGMYLLAYRWTGNRLGAAAAGTAFAFNGFSWHGPMFPSLMAALAWMPWVILAAERGWRQGGRWLVLASLAGAVQLLSGGAEVILFTWLVLGVFWLAQFVSAETPRRNLLGRMSLIGCLAAGLAAAQMLPFLDLLAHSQRSANYGDSGGIVMPAWGWANYLVPLFHSFRTSQGVFLQPTQNWIASYYLGVGIVALALVALWRVRTLRVWLLAALALFSLLMALGSQAWLYDAVRRLVPLLGFIRFPVKFVMLATFLLPLLAAYGLTWLQTLPAEAWPRRWKQTQALALVLLACIALLLWVAWKFPLPTDTPVATLKNGAVRALFLVLLFGCIAFLRRATDAKAQRVFQAAFLVLLWLDVFTHAPNLNPTAPQSVFEPNAVRRFFGWGDQLQPGASRVAQSRESYWKIVTRLAGDQEVDVYGRRLCLFADLNLLDHVPKIDGIYPLELKGVSDVSSLVYFATNRPGPLQDFLGISRTSHPTNEVDWIVRDTFLPLVTAGQRPAFAADTAALAALGRNDFDPRRTVYLPLEAQGQVRATNAAQAKIISSAFSSHRLQVEVEAAAPALVVVAQAFYHPWRARVDGQPVPLWRANYAFQAIEVPAGKHQVSFAYEDRAFRWGALLSLASLLLCGILWCWYPGKQEAPVAASVEEKTVGAL